MRSIDDNGYTLTITETPLNELPTIKLNGSLNTPQASGKAYGKWYYLSFPAKGTFTIGGKEGDPSYNIFELYDADNVLEPVAKSKHVTGESGSHYVLEYEVPEAGDYLIGLIGSYGCKVYTTWVEDETSGINSVNADSRIVEVYDITGRKVSKLGNQGIFIVKTADGQTKKINMNK